MCDAGRVRRHLKEWLWRREGTVLLVGFQAQGSLGRILQEGAKRVRIQGEEIEVRAAIRSLDLYSGHADARELERWIAARAPIPLSWSYAALRRFHGGAAATMVATPTLQQELDAQGFGNLVVWRRGIDLDPFLGAKRTPLEGVEGPVFLFVGRVAVEKNIEAFLDLDLPGTRIVVGDGPARAALMRRYPDVLFPGKKSGADLVAYYAAADVFVFPSLTDTFGLVMLEALAAGTPVAAFPVTGPREVLGSSDCGCMSQDLRAAALTALAIDRQACRRYASRFTMQASARSFFTNIANVIPVPALAARLAGL
jgi:glycosyltransferase involved in cell wall biosynthesis